MRRAAIVSLIFVSCAGQPSTVSQDAAPLPLSAPKEFLSQCAVACVRSRQMQAISAQMIDAQCEDLCRIEWSYPALLALPQVAMLDGQRARVVGVLASGAGPAIVKLDDGGRVLLRGGPGIEATEVNRLNGQRVIAVGTVAKGPSLVVPVEIEHVTTVAPAPGS